MDAKEAKKLIKNFYKKIKEKKMNKNEEFKNASSISIEKNCEENTVSATLYGRRPITNEPYIIKTYKAKCSSDDIFDFNIGAKLAMDRLYEGYDMTPKPKRKPLNGKILVVWSEEVYDTFTVIDGKIGSMLYVLRLPCQQKDTIYEDSSFEEMKQALLNCASFIWYNGKSPKAICRDYETFHI